jgi:hypothetical protein
MVLWLREKLPTPFPEVQEKLFIIPSIFEDKS